MVNRIHIKKLRLKDNHVYRQVSILINAVNLNDIYIYLKLINFRDSSCWQKDKLVGTVRLNIEKKLKIGFDHHITLVGILAIIVTFLLIGMKVVTREMQKKKIKN